jgi:hypothetical protein
MQNFVIENPNRFIVVTCFIHNLMGALLSRSMYTFIFVKSINRVRRSIVLYTIFLKNISAVFIFFEVAVW